MTSLCNTTTATATAAAEATSSAIMCLQQVPFLLSNSPDNLNENEKWFIAYSSSMMDCT